MTNKQLKKLYRDIRVSCYNWWDANRDLDKLHLTASEYLELCKFAIALYPDQILHVRADKMSDSDYYTVCKVMASHGTVTNDLKYEKLKGAGAIFDIWETALLNKQGYFDGRTTIYAIKSAQEKNKYLSPREYAQICLIMYLKFPGKVTMRDICTLYNRGLLTDADVEPVVNKIIAHATMDFYEPFDTAVNTAYKYDTAFPQSGLSAQNKAWLDALRNAQFKILNNKIKFENHLGDALRNMSQSHSK